MYQEFLLSYCKQHKSDLGTRTSLIMLANLSNLKDTYTQVVPLTFQHNG